MQKTYNHIEGIQVIPQWSEEKPPLYRYKLEIKLQPGSKKGKTACVILQNPSVADEVQADKSIQFMEKVVFLHENFRNEFDGVRRLIIVNLYAWRQTKDFEESEDKIGKENNKAIEEAMNESSIIIIGWGKTTRFQGQREFVYGLLKQMKGKIIYKTKTHPARAQYDGFIQPYRRSNI